MILFVGKQESGFFCEDVAEQRKLKCAYVPENLHIERQAKEVLRYKEVARYAVFDIEQYADEPQEIEGWILKIQDAIGVKVIIFAPGYSSESKIISGLYCKGIKNFIFSVYLTEQKEDLELCMDGYFESFGYEKRGITFEEREEKAEEETENRENRGKTIGIAGAVARMGTTTQAIQFVKYLHFIGYRAAYIQMNSHGWVEQLKEAYSDTEHDPEKGLVSYQGVDMYYRLNRLQDVLKKYDYYVYDYGVFSEHDFNKISFLEKEIQIFVVGSKPGEFDKTYQVVKNNFYNRNFYIFNFIAEAEKKDLLELMEEKAKDTFFAGEVRDPFSYDGQDGIYGKILPIKSQNVEQSKKAGFFRRRKNR